MLQYYIMKPLFLKNRSLVQSYHHSMGWKHSPLCLETLGISLLFNNSRVSKNGSTPGFLKGLRSDQQQPIFFVKIAPTQEKSNTISGQGFWRPHEWAFLYAAEYNFMWSYQLLNSNSQTRDQENFSVSNNWWCQGPWGLRFCPSLSNGVATLGGQARHPAEVLGGIAQCKV